MYIEKFIIKEAFLKVALLVGIERACSSVVPYQTKTTSIKLFLAVCVIYSTTDIRSP